MPDSISCPYCNAIMPAGTAGPAPLSICPRCGEVLPAQLIQGIQARPSGDPLPVPPLAKPQAALRPPLRRVAGIVVGIMGVMAILSFAYAWHTVNWRRSRDPKPAVPVAKPQAAVKPIELAALGYLPPETAVVAALHIAELEKTPRGKEFLQAGRIGNIPINAADIEGWTGLKISEIDHVVIGLKLESRLIPAILLVVQARQPVDQTKIRDTLKAERSIELGKKKAWQYNLRISSKVSLEGVLWFASPNTLVVSLSKLDMEKLPDQPTTLAKQLPTALQDTIKERIEPGAHAWLAGHIESWDAVTPLLSLVMDKPNLETLTSLRTFGFGVRLDSGIHLAGRVQGVDDAATAALQTRWTQMTVPESSKELQPFLRELAKSYRREIKDGWLILTAEANEQIANRP
jgi:hypothetical protein